jgi:hypothetical protein
VRSRSAAKCSPSVACPGGPLTPDYTGVVPWAFKGGTIQKVVVDVSGDHYVDLELEAMKAFKND